MARHAVRGISAPPEVVFSTATDPDRRAAWLPAELVVEPGGGGDLRARLIDAGAAAGELSVRPGDSGGSSVELRFDGDAGADSPDDILRALEREVADNFNAG